MLNPILNEISTNESPTQSPKKIQNQIKIQPPYINLYLQKLKIEEKNFYLDDISCDKKERDEKNKEGENSVNDRRIDYNENRKKSDKNDKNGILLDFDFLVGEFLDKIILGKNISSLKENMKKKVDIHKRKNFTKIKTIITKTNNEQNSKLYFILISNSIFIL